MQFEMLMSFGPKEKFLFTYKISYFCSEYPNSLFEMTGRPKGGDPSLRNKQLLGQEIFFVWKYGI